MLAGASSARGDLSLSFGGPAPIAKGARPGEGRRHIAEGRGAKREPHYGSLAPTGGLSAGVVAVECDRRLRALCSFIALTA
jgi:hypothetical protein